MVKTIGAVLLAALVWGGIAYADGQVLSVVSPPADEMKEPAKPAKKVSAKKTPKKAAPKAAKKTKRKVAPPASQNEALVQPVGNEAQKQAKADAPHMAPEPAMVLLPRPAAEKTASEKRTPEKIIKTEKPKTPGQVYVLFQSTPPNAEVVVDGYYAGSTPLELPIREGNHTLRLIYPGYEEWEHKFNAYKGMRVSALMVEKKQAQATP
ncbi:MAG: PEGA domain-containing protein [Nitrospinae bacterium]|nr:PEGA domain-containing protein [Nitrospinota bacterium]